MMMEQIAAHACVFLISEILLTGGSPQDIKQKIMFYSDTIKSDDERQLFAKMMLELYPAGYKMFQHQQLRKDEELARQLALQ